MNSTGRFYKVIRAHNLLQMIMTGWFRDAPSGESWGAWLSSPGAFGKSSYAPVAGHVHIPSRVPWGLLHLSWEASIKPQDIWPWDLQAVLFFQPPSYLLCLDISLRKVKSGIRMRWLIFVIEMDEFSNMHVYSLPYSWASVGTAIHPPAQTFMARGLPWPVPRHASFAFLSAVQGSTSK